jgi:phage terminase small subunit
MSTPLTPKEAAAAALKILSPQQRKFVLAYCDTFNATKAALAAKYSEKTARQQGSRLLTNVDIKAAVKAVLATASMEPEEIAARWTALARAGLSDFYTVVDYEETTKVQQPLAAYIAERQRQVDFEEKVHERQHLTSPEAGAKHFLRQLERKNEIIRLQVELEMNPDATRTVDGPKVTKQRVQLDLVKAEALGLLDMVKTIAPTEFGLKVELRSPDTAMDNLAKWRGMLTTKVDITSGGEPVATPAILGVLTLEQKKQILEAKRKAQEGQPNA